MASASKELSGGSGLGPSAEAGTENGHGVGERPSLGEVSSMAVHVAVHDELPFGRPEIQVPGRQIEPPKDPSAVTIKFIPEPPRHHRWNG